MKNRLLISFFLLLSLQGFGQKTPQYFNFSDTVFQVGAIHNLPEGTWWNWSGTPYPDNEDSLAVDFVSKNLNIKFEIVCHTDSRPIPMTTDTLSSRRAEYIMNDFLVKGVPFDQISSRGAAGHEPLILSKDTVIKYKQESFSFKKGTILNDSLINSLSSFEYREAAHSLNRRVELKIVKIMEPEIIYSGIVLDDYSKKPISNVLIKLVNSLGRVEYDTSNNDGKFKLKNLQENCLFDVLIKSDKYYTGKKKFSTIGICSKKVFYDSIKLTPMTIYYDLFESIKFKNGKSKITSSNRKDIDVNIVTLFDNPNIVVEIVGGKDYNESNEIIERRANAIKDYMIKKGIAADKLLISRENYKPANIFDPYNTSGYPPSVCNVDLTEKYINSLSKKNERLQAHQICRSVNFKVVRIDYVPKKTK